MTTLQLQSLQTKTNTVIQQIFFKKFTKKTSFKDTTTKTDEDTTTKTGKDTTTMIQRYNYTTSKVGKDATTNILQQIRYYKDYSKDYKYTTIKILQ